MDHQPNVSIGVPVYNGARYLAGALDQLLAQTYRDFEIVISDNGSSDATPQIARTYAARDPRIRYVRFDDTVNPFASFCRAVSQARGRLFTWAAVDDGRPPEAIAACVAAMEREPSAVMAHGPVIADLAREHRRVEVPNGMDLSSQDAARRVRVYTDEMQYNGMLYALYRLDVLRCAVFRYHPGHDYLLPLQIVAHGPAAYTTTPMLVYNHVWGEVDTPMYRRERITLRDLLVYRGIRRRKCTVTLLNGLQYLLAQRGVSVRNRVRTALTHAARFVRRYRWHLASEVVFLAFTPLVWILAPAVPTGRRLKRAWVGAPAPRQS